MFSILLLDTDFLNIWSGQYMFKKVGIIPEAILTWFENFSFFSFDLYNGILQVTR